MKNKTLTISVAAYNSQDYLDRAIDSCLVNNLDQLEIIIVDDGSTDDTGIIADTYASEYPDSVKVIHKNNGHYGSAFNASLGIARGKYYKLLDSDDWLNKGALQEYIDILNASDADIALTPSVRHIEGETELIDPAGNLDSGVYASNDIGILKIPEGISNLTFSTAFLREIGIKLLEGCGYVDNELRIITWMKARRIQVNHLPLYNVYKGRADQTTSLESLQQNATASKKVFWSTFEKSWKGKDIKSPSASEIASLNALGDLASSYYISVLLSKLDKNDAANELRNYDYLLREAGEHIYKLAGKNRYVSLLRRTNFFLFPVVRKVLLARWKY